VREKRQKAVVSRVVQRLRSGGLLLAFERWVQACAELRQERAAAESTRLAELAAAKEADRRQVRSATVLPFVAAARNGTGVGPMDGVCRSARQVKGGVLQGAQGACRI